MGAQISEPSVDPLDIPDQQEHCNAIKGRCIPPLRSQFFTRSLVPIAMNNSAQVDNGSELPAYSFEAVRASGSEPGSPALTYTSPSPASFPEPRHRELYEHTHVLTDSKNKPWATLTLQSCNQSSQQMPIFVDDQPIEGSLSLDLDRKESITSVSIIVMATFTRNANLRSNRLLQIREILAGSETREPLAVSDSYVFLNQIHTLWTKTNKDPLIPTPFPLSMEIRRGAMLTGRHCWPFSLRLPKDVDISPTSSEPPQTCRLPQTLLERFTTVSIQYEFIVEFIRGFLRSNSK
jgi:hypothetical protein